MMLPTTVLTCVTLVACFAGHADAFYVDKGLCYNRATGKNDRNAGDVTGIVTGYIGTTTCYVGGPPINGRITMSLTVTTNKQYAIGVYIGLNGANAETDEGDSSCLVRTLEASDATPNSGRVGQIDNDECWDFDKGLNNDG